VEPAGTAAKRLTASTRYNICPVLSTHRESEADSSGPRAEAGRPVFGGGGIIPDIYVEPIENSALVDEVITLGYLDDFVNDYGEKNDIGIDFKVSDKLIDEFYQYLQNQHYVFRDELFIMFDDFKSSIESRPDDSRLKKNTVGIEEILKLEAADKLHAETPAFRQLIYEYTIRRNFGDKSALELSGQYTDPEINKAGAVLRSPETYSSLLVGY